MRVPSEQHRRDRLGGDADLAPSSLQDSTLPRAARPKVKSSPVTTPAAPIWPAEEFGDEILGAGRGERRRRSANTSIASAPAWANKASRWSRLVSRNGGSVGLEEAHRVRVEGGDDDRPPLVVAARDRAPDDRLVAEVEAVEIAERDDAAAKRVGHAAIEGQPLHCRRLYRPLPLHRQIALCGLLALDSTRPHSYLQPIPFHRFRRRIRARVGFSFVDAGLFSDEMGGIRGPWS